MVNKKDFAIRKIYLSYCYKRDSEGGGREKRYSREEERLDVAFVI